MSAPDRSEGTNPSSQDIFRLVSLGDSAITVEFGDTIDPLINARVIAFAKTVIEQGWSGIFDVVPTYRSITVHFDPLHWHTAALSDTLNTLPRPGPSETEPHGALHQIPVLYGGGWGPDLADVAAFAGWQPARPIP